MFLPLLVVLEHTHWGVGSRASQGGVSIRQVQKRDLQPSNRQGQPTAFGGIFGKRQSQPSQSRHVLCHTNCFGYQNGGHVQRAL